MSIRAPPKKEFTSISRYKFCAGFFISKKGELFMRVIHSLPKRLLAFFLALLTCLALLPFSAIQTAQAATGDTAVVDHFETIGRNYVIQPYIQGLPANSRFAQYQGVVL